MNGQCPGRDNARQSALDMVNLSEPSGAVNGLFHSSTDESQGISGSLRLETAL